MQKLVFRNSRGVEIDLTSGNYGITNWTGLSETSLDVQSQTVPFHDGSVYLDSLLKERTIGLTLAIKDDGSLEKRYRLKRELISILNPKLGEGELLYTNDFLSKSITCVPDIPKFANKNSVDSGTLKANLTFNCSDPFWKDLNETVVECNLNEKISIRNDGDVETDCIFEILTKYIQNPQIKNYTNGKVLSLNGNFTKNIFFSSEFGKKEIYINDSVFQQKYFKKFNSMAYNPDIERFVAVGEKGTISYSDDGINWISTYSGTPWDLNSVFYFAPSKLFIAFSQTGGYEWWSDNGVDWNQIQGERVPGSSTMGGVSYLPNQSCLLYWFGNDKIVISYDGLNWEIQSTVASTNYYMNKIVEFQNKFVFMRGGTKIVSSSSLFLSLGDEVFKSFDDTIYDAVSSDKLNLLAIGGVGGKIYTTRNLQTWETIQTPATGNVRKLIYNNFCGFVGITDLSEIIYSSDGINWFNSNLNLNGDASCMSYNNEGNLSILGENGLIVHSELIPNFEIIRQSLGTSVGEINSMSSHDGKYILTCGKILYTTDFENFTVCEIETEYQFKASVYFPLNDCFYALATDGSYHWQIWKSSDGVDWSLDYDMGSVTYDSIGSFITCSDEILAVNLTSFQDGYSYQFYFNLYGLPQWSRMFDGRFQKKDFYFSKTLNRFCSSVNHPQYTFYQTKLDGQYDPDSFIFIPGYGPIADNGRYIIVAYTNKILRTIDGINWETFSNPFENITGIYGLTTINGKFYLSTPSQFAVSEDGVVWDVVKVNGGNLISEYELKKVVLGTTISIDSGDYQKGENIISKVNPFSNIDLNLEVGENVLSLKGSDGDAKMIVRYRNKYVGV